MSTTLQPLYASNATITLTGTSLGNGSYRQSAAVDNTTNKYGDANIYGQTKSSGTPTASGTYTLYLYWSNDNGTTYCNNASGSDATYTPDLQANLISGVSIGTTATASLVSYFTGFSFCRAANLNILPSKWGVILLNSSGAAMSATSTDTKLSYQGINWQAN